MDLLNCVKIITHMNVKWGNLKMILPKTGFKKGIAASLVLLLLAVCATEAFEVHFSKGNALTLHSDKAYLQDILGKLARQGITIRIDPEINFPVTARFENKPVRAAMDQILKDYNFALIWSQPDPNAPDRFALHEIQIFKKGAKQQLQPLDFNRNLSIIRDPQTGTRYVQGEVLVRLQSTTNVKELRKVVAEVGGAIEGKNPIGLYRIRLPENVSVKAFVKKIEGMETALAEPNYVYSMPLPRAYTVHPIALPDLAENKSPRKEAPVAIYDSGISPLLSQEGYIAAAFNTLDPNASVSDHLGHGTQMALIASGTITPLGADTQSHFTTAVVAIQGFDENGITSNDAVTTGIHRAIESGARVLSLSWHTQTQSRFLETCLTEASKKGLIVVAAAGNTPTGEPVYPAAYPDVIAVGALQTDGSDWKQSNFGDFVDVKAPGFANMPVGYKGPPGIYAGTSISTAFVAHQIAGYLMTNPNATREQILHYLKSIEN